jgi:hypothetical protein
MKSIWFIVPVLLAGCSYAMPISGGSENGGTVNLVATSYGEDNAMEAAQRHCDQYHRVARMLHHDESSNSMSFTCEVPGKPYFDGPINPGG